jgi:hypothetical protein
VGIQKKNQNQRTTGTGYWKKNSESKKHRYQVFEKNRIKNRRFSYITSFGIGEGPEYRPFCDLRSVPETSRPREQVKNHGRACTQVLSLRKALPGIFHFLEILTGRLWYLPLVRRSQYSLAGTFHRTRSGR